MSDNKNENETYTVLFITQGKNATAINGSQNVQFYVNWASILPNNKTKYKCEFVFKSSNVASALSANYLISCNIGRPQVYDGTTPTFNLGFVYPVICGSTYWLTSTNNDNNDITIVNPNASNIVNIQLLNFDLTAPLTSALPSNWVLILNLSPL